MLNPLVQVLVVAAFVLAGAPVTGTDATPGVAMSPRVVRIAIDLKLDPQAGLIHERAEVTIAGSGVNRLVFRLDHALVVEAASASEGLVEHRHAGDDLVVDVDPPIEGTRTLRFVVTGRPMRGPDPLVASDVVLLGPFDAWYPVHGATWAETSVTIRVPRKWTAVAPGSRVKTTDANTFAWRTTRPVRTIAVAGGPGLRLTETSVLAQPLRVAAPPEGPAPAVIAGLLRDAMAWMSGALAPYPFDGFNVVVLPRAPGRVRAGGLIAVPAATPLETPSDGADLLSGQWFGERLAGDGPWIEAWAAWQGVVFARDRALPLPTEIVRLREGYFRLLSGDVPLARATAATPDEVVRGKGSAAPDMIRLVAGDADFFRAVRTLFGAPVNVPWTLAGLRDVFESAQGPSLRRVFEDWFERAGAPEIEASMRTLPSEQGMTRVDLTLVQKRGAFRLPVEIVFVGAGREHRETVEIDEAETRLVFDLPFEPARVEVDPGGKLFRRK